MKWPICKLWLKTFTKTTAIQRVIMDKILVRSAKSVRSTQLATRIVLNSTVWGIQVRKKQIKLLRVIWVVIGLFRRKFRLKIHIRALIEEDRVLLMSIRLMELLNLLEALWEELPLKMLLLRTLKLLLLVKNKAMLSMKV